jgi:hypothetical protein
MRPTAGNPANAGTQLTERPCLHLEVLCDLGTTVVKCILRRVPGLLRLLSYPAQIRGCHAQILRHRPVVFTQVHTSDRCLRLRAIGGTRPRHHRDCLTNHVDQTRMSCLHRHLSMAARSAQVRLRAPEDHLGWSAFNLNLRSQRCSQATVECRISLPHLT